LDEEVAKTETALPSFSTATAIAVNEKAKTMTKLMVVFIGIYLRNWV
jgi:hypothetical protein